MVSRVIIRVTPFRALIALLITYLLSFLPLQVPTLRLESIGCVGKLSEQDFRSGA